jgi:ABC-type branched-subunit amino acid transport system substrate-binding protein
LPDSGIAPLKQAIDAAGGGIIPLLSWDGLNDGSGTDEGSFIQLAGPDAAKSYATAVSVAPPLHSFEERYRSAYGQAPVDQYTGAGQACAQVIIDALRAIAPTGPDATTLREALRASVVDPSRRYDTALGNVGFDANGDSIHQFVTFYKTDLGALGGKGDWIYVKEQDFLSTP